MLELGDEITKQLGRVAQRDLLAAWMAQYLAEKMLEAKSARGHERSRLESECRELIFKLWAHRHSLPDGARPLESFEPVFAVLSELSQDKPRYSLLRAVPPIRKGARARTALQEILTIDQCASSLVRWQLASALEEIDTADKRWTQFLTLLEPSTWDLEIVYSLIGEAELLSSKEKLKKDQLDELERMIQHLDYFNKSVDRLRKRLQDRIEAVKK